MKRFFLRKRDIRRKEERGALQIHVQSSDEHTVATIIALKVLWNGMEERKKERKERFSLAER